MTLKQAINYWLKSAERNFSAAKDLYKTKHYVECLFFCHLTIEKTLKALIVKNTDKAPLPIHHLPELSKKTGFKFSKKQLILLGKINEFNIRTRYDNYKFKFYKKATKKYTKEYLEKVEKLFQWLKKSL